VDGLEEGYAMTLSETLVEVRQLAIKDGLMDQPVNMLDLLDYLASIGIEDAQDLYMKLLTQDKRKIA
jgi:hypothetical protein